VPWSEDTRSQDEGDITSLPSLDRQCGDRGLDCSRGVRRRKFQVRGDGGEHARQTLASATDDDEGGRRGRGRQHDYGLGALKHCPQY